jgi:predicted AAA+ superfamily ATPase
MKKKKSLTKTKKLKIDPYMQGRIDAIEDVIKMMEDPQADWCRCGGWCVQPSELRALSPTTPQEGDR